MSDDRISPEYQEAIAECLYDGRKIEAIKRYRESTGLGLKESKEFIDSLEKTLRQSQPGNFRVAESRGCAPAAAALLLAALGLLGLV